MRLSLALAAFMAGTTLALAQDVPNPAVETVGTQTQSVELLKDSVVVTVESGGTANLGGGSSGANGGVGVDINGVGASVGSMPHATGQAGSAEPFTSGPSGNGVGGSNAGPTQSATGINPASGAGQSGLFAGGQGCITISGSVPTAAALQNLLATFPIVLVPSCGGAALTAAQQDTVRQSPALTQLLASYEIEAGQVVAIFPNDGRLVISYRDYP